MQRAIPKRCTAINSLWFFNHTIRLNGLPTKRQSVHTKPCFFEVVKQLGYPYKLATVFSVLPSTFNNWLYDKIALNRYTLFGKYQYCRIPSPEDAKHYL